MADAKRTWAGLRILGPSIVPNEVSRLLGKIPSRSHRAGASMGTTGKIWQHGFWSLKSAEHVDSSVLADHLAWLLEHINDVIPQLHALRDTGAIVDLVCFWETGTWNSGIVVPPALLNQLGETSLQLGIDIYVADEDL